MKKRKRSRPARDRARRTEATQRWRDRVHNGKAVCRVEYDAGTVDLLARTQWFTKPCEVYGRDDVGEAIGRMLREMVQGIPKK
jgi:hypothetical protein